jgi:hypothetical protein
VKRGHLDSTTGRRTMNSLPRPRPSLRASTLPPCIATRLCTRLRPIPKPSCERPCAPSARVNISKIRESISAGMPIQVSRTDTMWTFSSRHAARAMLPPSPSGRAPLLPPASERSRLCGACRVLLVGRAPDGPRSSASASRVPTRLLTRSPSPDAWRQARGRAQAWEVASGMDAERKGVSPLEPRQMESNTEGRGYPASRSNWRSLCEPALTPCRSSAANQIGGPPTVKYFFCRRPSRGEGPGGPKEPRA